MNTLVDSMADVPLRDWSVYYDRCVRNRAHQTPALVLRALELCVNFDRALDLGSGTMDATILMLLAGFKSVTAVDSSPLAENYAAEVMRKAPRVLSFRREWFHDFCFGENRFDLIHSDMALQYSGKRHFREILSKVIRALRPSGVIALSLFGERHCMNGADRGVVYLSVGELRSSLQDTDCQPFEIEQRMRNGEKLHYVYAIGRKLNLG